ncbi:MAG: type II secretion system F family protein [Eubacteriales bacterium]|nr:type II secretion system F family protein [Bacillota bacterium]MBV1726648.1 type II secretion system F family protein [Desulforudis sp.]MDZ4042473.1 type II secretion system F family protein [Eubacteriales bacterium]MBV1735137.1 type II secretion system F family protein [Desulforudis sp.]MBV1770766.1 type II secretion system F family protein [Desulforudis sp.]
MSQLKFRYKARNRSGKLVGGTITADSEAKARVLLRERQLFVVEVKAAPTQKGSSLFSVGKKVKPKDLAVFCRQLSTMVQAGMPLLTCFNVLGQQSDNVTLRETAASVAQSLETGRTLSESFRDYPKIFPQIFTSMVEAGEVAGALEEVLERLAIHFEKDADIRSKVKGAMMMPAVVIAVAIIAVIIILTFVLPTFIKMLTDLNVPLPLPTRATIALSEFLQSFWYIVLAVCGIGFAGFKRYAATPKGRKVVDRGVLRLPVFGVLIRKMVVARVCRILSSLVRSGVPLLQALAIVRSVAGNETFASAIRDAENSVKEGEGLAPPLERSKVFPPMVTRMIAIGEDTGAVDSLLEKVAHFYEREVDDTVSNLSKILEPILMVGIGGIVGFILMSVYLPMFSIVGSMQ